MEASYAAKKVGGFTIIEIMLVLAASSLIGLSTLAFLSDEIGNNSFLFSSKLFTNQIKQAIVDNASGYYTHGGVNCDPTTSPSVTIHSGTTGEGSSLGCISLGDALEFQAGSLANQYLIIPLAGYQYSDAGDDLTEAVGASQPTAVEISTPTINTVRTQALTGGLQIQSVTAYWQDASGVTHTASPGTIGLLLADSNGTIATQTGNSLNPGVLPTSLYYVNNTDLSLSQAVTATKITADNLVPASKVEICASSGGQSVKITIDGTDSSDVSSQTYDSDSTCS